MSSYLLTYLIFILDNIKALLSSCYILLFIVYNLVIAIYLFASVPYWDYNSNIIDNFIENIKKTKIFHIIIILTISLTFSLNSVIPTSKQMILIYVIPKITSIENNNIPPNILNTIKEYLEKNNTTKLNEK